MSTTIEDRVILLLKEQMSPAEQEAAQEGTLMSLWRHWRSPPYAGRGFWEKLSSLTDTPSQRWRSVFTRRQKPTPSMIQALARLWPSYAFWLATGITDAANGHIAPMTALTFPERVYSEDGGSSSYFHQCLELLERLYTEGGVPETDDEARLEAAERIRPLAHWVGGKLVETAYALSRSEEYARLVATWERREGARPEHVGMLVGTYRPWEEKQRELEKAGVQKTPTPGADPRTTHQSSWDLFYKPRIAGE
ncbi:hypothetical protein ACUXAV_004539 [Cupriavidus metallidurans]|uniref:hypothetical protein n=1 Tax=Cupriavidus metallidurans TaxID=119219 RepID=UPI0004939A86|nr:hypothetical protein [Cupriavidus metallidurans]MDE4919574.1 hypothetical protein [Cupriavidus metallidurans]